MVSGEKHDKFEETGLTPVAAQHLKVPIIQEAPLALECHLKSITKLGSHDLFLAEVMGVQVEGGLLDQSGKLDLAQAESPLLRAWTVLDPAGSSGEVWVFGEEAAAKR